MNTITTEISRTFDRSPSAAIKMEDHANYCMDRNYGNHGLRFNVVAHKVMAAYGFWRWEAEDFIAFVRAGRASI